MSVASQFLIDLRYRAGLSQAELARAAGTSQPAIARLEAGTADPGVETLARLARAAGFTLELRAAAPALEDAVIAAYKRDVDRTLIRENLRRSVDERLRMLADAVALGEALDAARPRRSARSGHGAARPKRGGR